MLQHLSDDLVRTHLQPHLAPRHVAVVMQSCARMLALMDTNHTYWARVAGHLVWRDAEFAFTPHLYALLYGAYNREMSRFIDAVHAEVRARCVHTTPAVAARWAPHAEASLGLKTRLQLLRDEDGLRHPAFSVVDILTMPMKGIARTCILHDAGIRADPVARGLRDWVRGFAQAPGMRDVDKACFVRELLSFFGSRFDDLFYADVNFGDVFAALSTLVHFEPERRRAT